MERGYYHHEDCGCGHHGHPLRHFPTKGEITQKMEDYLKQLQVEVKVIVQRLAEMKKGG